MADLNSLMTSGNPQQAAAHLASLYFGIPRTFFPLTHMAPSSGANINHGDIPGPVRTNTPSSYSPMAGNSMANQALYATRLQLSRLYPGLRFHPYFQPRLVHPPSVPKSTVDSSSDCDTMSPNVWERTHHYACLCHQTKTERQKNFLLDVNIPSWRLVLILTEKLSETSKWNSGSCIVKAAIFFLARLCTFK